MKKMFILMMLGMFSASLFAYSDSDMDGVDDSRDKCPNTPLTDLVDINGCTKKSLVSSHHFDIIIGANYAGSNYASLNQTDTYSSSLQIDYYYKNFSLQASTSYYTTNGDGYSENGLNDSFLGASYQFKPLKSFSLRVGAGVLLPTYDTALNNNNTDYTASLNASYALGKVNIFGGYIYTMINDDDIAGTVAYQNTNAFSGGLGYYVTNKLYLSGAYNTSDSIYAGVEKIRTVSAYGYYSINMHWFTTFSYAYGLSDSASDQAASVKLGYYF
ncbi:DUF3187 domain-containing protein [Sulfurimonas sp. NW15]|uniref:DUF3187 domain-containing protein n=1 Tax=Sulfurimonas sp. NW15 TaxID=2922729 RepID=UPI003DA98941